MTHYRHTQPGWVILLTVGAAILMMLASGGSAAVLWPAYLLLGAIGVLFASLTVIVDDKYVHVAYGPGFIQFHFPLSEIQACETVRNPWIAGWGIRWIGNGWLFNVSGLDAVQLDMKNGKVYRIGTDEPQALRDAIELRR
ncbi:MAG: hypothetical protein ACK47B_14840 [Armatimonadota bacterium]